VHAARDPIMSSDEPARLVTSGWVGVTRVLTDGRRQILQVAIAGDFVSPPPLLDGHVVALTTGRTADAGGLIGGSRRAQAPAPPRRRPGRAPTSRVRT